jgi:hypothetical protein
MDSSGSGSASSTEKTSVNGEFGTLTNEYDLIEEIGSGDSRNQHQTGSGDSSEERLTGSGDFSGDRRDVGSGFLKNRPL